ncbi:MAG: RIP metalloprotease RseP [Myxococcota bacterium]
MNDFLYVVQNLHWFGLLIGALVLFHELGHFVAARAFGVRVLRFSFGFGPRLLSVTRGDTEYRLSLLPLGGYVKMLGELPDMEVSDAERPRAFSHKPVWQRAIIALAGPAANLLLALVVYLVMFSGTHTFGATRLGVVTPGGPAWQAGVRPGDSIVQVDGQAVGDWDALRDAIRFRPGEPLALVYERNGAAHQVEVLPEAHAEADVFNEEQTRGRIGISLQYLKPVVAVIDLSSPAAHAGVKTDDVVREVGGRKVSAWHELRDAVAATPAGELVRLTLERAGTQMEISLVPVGERPAGVPAELVSSADAAWGYTGLVSKNVVVTQVEGETPASRMGLAAGDRLLRLVSTSGEGKRVEQPINVWELDLAAFQGADARHAFTLTYQRGSAVHESELHLDERSVTDEFKNRHTQYVFGAHNDGEVIDTYLFERNVSLPEAVTVAAKQVGEDMTLIARGIGKMISGHIPIDTMGGPIMLFVIAEKSAKRGFEFFARMLAVISVNLGMLNLLPVPVLDGGHLLFFGIEAVRRRPASTRTREVANAVGLALLLLLMVLVFRNDILRYVLG